MGGGELEWCVGHGFGLAIRRMWLLQALRRASDWHRVRQLSPRQCRNRSAGRLQLPARNRRTDAAFQYYARSSVPESDQCVGERPQYVLGRQASWNVVMRQTSLAHDLRTCTMALRDVDRAVGQDVVSVFVDRPEMRAGVHRLDVLVEQRVQLRHDRTAEDQEARVRARRSEIGGEGGGGSWLI
jgi:hypothetical protein